MRSGVTEIDYTISRVAYFGNSGIFYKNKTSIDWEVEMNTTHNKLWLIVHLINTAGFATVNKGLIYNSSIEQVISWALVTLSVFGAIKHSERIGVFNKETYLMPGGDNEFRGFNALGGVVTIVVMMLLAFGAAMLSPGAELASKPEPTELLWDYCPELDGMQSAIFDCLIYATPEASCAYGDRQGTWRTDGVQNVKCEPNQVLSPTIDSIGLPPTADPCPDMPGHQPPGADCKLINKPATSLCFPDQDYCCGEDFIDLRDGRCVQVED